MKIKSVNAIEILDSRGNPTVETEIILEDGSKGRAGVPSGASTGKYEAVELRDNDLKRFNGLGVLGAVKNVNAEIAAKIIGMDAVDQTVLDKTMIELDGTENKSRLGANAILSVSLAAAKAEAESEKKPLYEYLTKFDPDFNGAYKLPTPLILVLEGGKHADQSSDIQEFMIIARKAENLAETIRIGSEIYHSVGKVLKQGGFNTNVGYEGAYGPSLKNNEKAFQVITEGIKAAGYGLNEIAIAIDSAASELWENNRYFLKSENRSLNSLELADFYADLIANYPIISIEDGFAEDDWSGWTKFTKKMAGKIQIMGDDLTVTNIKRIRQAIDARAVNSVLIKPNQIGTLTETVEAILVARKNGLASTISHRSGETEDTFIADFATAMGTGQIKTGAPARGERTCKYNRLIKIERELKGRLSYSRS